MTAGGIGSRRLDGARTTPWYRQFWPWFLIALPTAAVVASIASLVIALRNADSLVRPDWSEAGDAINVELALEREAASRAIIATISLDPREKRLSVVLSGRADTTRHLTLVFRHPTDAARDVSLNLPALDDGSFAGEVPAYLLGSWHLAIAPPDRSWLLRKRVWIDAVIPTRLHAESTG
jgi:hypothetical protein